MTAGDGGRDWGIALAGIGLAVAFAVAGAIVLARRVIALRKRLREYGELPVVDLARRVSVSTASLPRTLHTASQLVPRTQRALIDMQQARDSLARSSKTAAATATALRRLLPF